MIETRTLSARRKALFTAILIALNAVVLWRLGVAIRRMCCGPPNRYILSTAEFRFRVSLNSDGYRDDEFVKAKPPQSLRILLIGDSYVFGVADKPDVIDTQLERLLSRTTGKACEVFSLGLPGLGLTEYWQILNQFVGYEPDAIVVLLYIDNDISQGAEEPRSEPEEFSPFGFQPRPDDMDDLDHLRPKLEELVSEGKLAKDMFRLMMRGRLNPYLYQLAERGPMNAHYDGLAKAFTRSSGIKDTILAMAKKAQSVHAGFLLCLAPGKYQVRKFKGWEVLKKLNVQWDDAVLNNRKIQDAVLQFCAKHAVECVDALPAMKRCPARCYYKIDDHMNAEGNRVVAAAISHHLLARGLLHHEPRRRQVHSPSTGHGRARP